MELDFDQMGIPAEEDEDSPYPEVFLARSLIWKMVDRGIGSSVRVEH